jgi:hypothetical protein
MSKTANEAYDELEAQRQEEFDLVRQVLVKVFKAEPDPEPPGELRYRLPGGGYDDIFHARARWLKSTDGALRLVKEQGWKAILIQPIDKDIWTVSVVCVEAQHLGSAAGDSLPYAIIEAVLRLQAKLEGSHDRAQ